MSGIREDACLFSCGADELVGVVSRPCERAAAVGVLVIVGGPQYRVGSHRQFVLLGRELAEQGISCMRFDYRGMGDATGDSRSFEAVSEDVGAAVDAFFNLVPELEHVVLWGLCDGASAACFFAPRDKRVCGLVLLNPWVRTDQGKAKTYLKYYYLRRLFSRGFWLKLVRGGLQLGQSVSELGRAVGRAHGVSGVADLAEGLPTRMLKGLETSALPVLVILSGRDFVAREFEQLLGSSQGWSELAKKSRVLHLEGADHTFSSSNQRARVCEMTIDWCRSLLRLDGCTREI